METETKKDIIKKFSKSEKEHLKIHKNDKSSYSGLRKMVGQRKRFLRYLSGKDIEEYRKLTKELGLRK